MPVPPSWPTTSATVSQETRAEIPAARSLNDHVLSLIREDTFSRLRERLHGATACPSPFSPKLLLDYLFTGRGAGAPVKMAMIALAMIIGLGFMLMPVLVRPPQTIESPPGSDPARPH